MKITVAGVGYVGLSLAVLLAQKHQVTAITTTEKKAEMLENILKSKRKKSPYSVYYKYATGIASVFAIAVISITSIPVISECLCWILALNLLEALGDMFSLKNISQLLSSCASALSLLTVLLVLISIVFILSIGLIMIIKGG